MGGQFSWLMNSEIEIARSRQRNYSISCEEMEKYCSAWNVKSRAKCLGQTLDFVRNGALWGGEGGGGVKFLFFSNCLLLLRKFLFWNEDRIAIIWEMFGIFLSLNWFSNHFLLVITMLHSTCGKNNNNCRKSKRLKIWWPLLSLKFSFPFYFFNNSSKCEKHSYFGWKSLYVSKKRPRPT